MASTFRWKAAAAIVLIALCGAAGYYAMSAVSALQPLHEFYAAAAPIDAPPPLLATPSASAQPLPDAQPVSTTGTAATTDAPQEPAIDAVREPAAPPAPIVPASLSNTSVTKDASATKEASATKDGSATRPVSEPNTAADRPTARPIADPIEPSAPRVSGAPSDALPAAPPPVIPDAPPIATRPASASSVAPTPSVPDPMATRAAVRTILDRYADAYSQLDANAAHRVWPAVDRDALSRAFDTLASQHVSLGECSINVTGARARAQCAGFMTWRPKVGDTASRTNARTWTFDLAKSGASWTIVSARIQNR